MEIDTRPRPLPIPEEVEDRLYKWDLFRKGDSSELVTGKRWPECLKGTIARRLRNGDWTCINIDAFEMAQDGTLDWENSCVDIPESRFVQYMDLLSDVVYHLTIMEHSIQLAKALEKKWVKAEKTNS